ncbi:MAG: hypothetical protein WCK67_12400 [bacterium]
MNFNDPFIILASVFLFLLVIILLIYAFQANQEKNISEIDIETMLKSCDISILGKESNFYHIKPEKSNLYMNYTVLDENKHKFAAINCINKYKTQIESENLVITAYIQTGSTYKGEVGAKSDKSIVLKINDEVVLEIRRTMSFKEEKYFFSYENMNYLFKKSLISVKIPTQLLLLNENQTNICGKSNRVDSTGFARDYCAVTTKDLPDLVKYCLLYLIILK